MTKFLRYFWAFWFINFTHKIIFSRKRASLFGTSRNAHFGNNFFCRNGRV